MAAGVVSCALPTTSPIAPVACLDRPPAIALAQQLLRLRGSLRARFVVVHGRGRLLPRGHDRVADEPLRLHLVIAREEGRVPAHGVGYETLVGLRRLGHESR